MQQDIQSKIEAFFSTYPRRKFSKGQILIYAGDDPQGSYCLEQGQVRQYDITDKGDEIVVNVFKAPAFFPISWVLNKTPNKYFFESFTDIAVRIGPADETFAFLKANQDVIFDLLSRVYHGVDGMQRRMAHLMGGDARTRVIFELILECKRFGKKQPNGSYILEMHESELASRAGLARETVSRHIGKLDHGSIVEVTHKAIIVKSLKKLEEELGEDM